MIQLSPIRASRLAVACLALFCLTGATSAKILKDDAPTRDLSVSVALPSLDLAVCTNPFVMQESEKTNVLRALLGEDVESLRLAGR
ncbi:hypothetical protein AU074_13695 [Pseudomonas sp. ATCC PTA-122608]|nr:hypothetical protein AU074_13695 [Pseudomonas sp. ATCC PTA-122608]